MATCYSLLWLTWWAFLGAKLSGAWASVSWPVITIPLDIIGFFTLVTLFILSILGVGVLTLARSNQRKDLMDVISKYKQQH